MVATAAPASVGRGRQSEKAEVEYRRALSLDASDPTVKNNFGVFLCERGKVDAARAYFMEVVGDAHYSTPEEVWTNAGICVKHKDIALAEGSEEHTSELQSLMRTAYAVFCLKKN